MSPDPHTPMSFLQGAQNVYMPQAKITMANTVSHSSSVKTDLRAKSSIFFSGPVCIQR